ncbi:MAG TPA: restriction endonuclease subunit S [Bellilinea sp.]|nr:restriction endonuclease subunit S [Bellilinea sp.]
MEYETLGKVAEIIMGQSPPGEMTNTDGYGLPLLNGPTEFGAHHPLPVQYTTEARKVASPGDLLFCVRGSTTGRMNWADRKYAIGRGIAAIRHRSSYELQPLVRAVIEYQLPELLNRATGSTFPNVSVSQLAELLYPTLDEAQQREIAHILGTLDDKIELNRRMNATLEAIARAIFKSWFVDFDPVHAKARGEQPYGMDADTAALFPDAFEDSELGPIPAGWGIADFGKLISQRKERVRERKATVLSAVAAGELVRSSEHFAKQVYSKDISKYIAVEQWDFAYNPSRINIGSIGMLKEPLVGAVSPVYVVFRPKSEFQWFLEFNLKQPHVQKWIVTLASGSVRQALSFRDFASIPCVIPPEPIIKIFNQMWIGLCDGIDAHGRESNTLAELRDTLLPKLISGEICVNALEEISGG